MASAGVNDEVAASAARAHAVLESADGRQRGGGIGVAVTGWLLAASGYVGDSDVQPESALNMLQFMYLWMPAIVLGIVALVLSRLKVEQANKKLRAELAEGGHDENPLVVG